MHRERLWIRLRFSHMERRRNKVFICGCSCSACDNGCGSNVPIQPRSCLPCGAASFSKYQDTKTGTFSSASGISACGIALSPMDARRTAKQKQQCSFCAVHTSPFGGSSYIVVRTALVVRIGRHRNCFDLAAALKSTDYIHE